MIFIGAEHYYFWLGIKAGVYRIIGKSDIGPNFGSKIQEKCLDSYMNGFVIGLETNSNEYKEWINEMD